MKKPSVTELIDILNKPALLFWANKIGLQGLSLYEYRKKKQDKGNCLHKQIQNKILYNTDIEDNLLSINYDRWVKEIEILHTEKTIETEYFVGRLDIMYIDKINNDVNIADFKSGKDIYLENKLQLCAYKMAFPDCKINIIELPKMLVKPIELNFEKGKEILICLSKIFQLKNEI